MANAKDEISTVSDTICCDDTICLNSALATGGKDSTHDRVCLAAEGFGNRNCFLQSMANNKELPFDMSTCVFALEQALSVRALQEMVSHRNKDVSGLSSGHRTLLYGHAVLLKHSHSNMYLSCLSTQSSSSDKLAFDVGLTLNTEGESCWWTIHPASKQRSEGEKVRVGDDLILVSVASERFLHIGADCQVIASFQQTLWAVQPVSSGVVRQKSMGFVFGSDVLRLFHGDECLTIPQRDVESSQRVEEDCESLVMYEAGAVTAHARSLWKIEYIRTKWTEACMGWGHTVRLRHMTSGKYLASTEDNQIITVHRDIATEDTTAFIVRQSKDDRKFSDSREDEGMGAAEIKYGDSFVFLQHMKTGLWLSYQTFETKKRGVGRVEEKKAILMLEGHMDDGLMLLRGQEEENKGASVIRKCTSLINRFIKALESLKTEGRMNHLWENISLHEIIMTLEDLIDYFAPPGNDIVFEERQRMLKALRNRQDLFQEEGMIALTLQMIDKCSQWKSMRRLAHLIGEESAEKWSDMINYLYLLLAALIQGNHSNCTQFASSKRIDWLVRRLEGQDSSKGVLDVLHSVLIDSPEALNVIKENHIRTIISLIDKHGRHPKVLEVLCSLCVGNGVAVRSNQNLIMENLLPDRDLLLQTRVVDYVFSMAPNIFVGRCENSSMYHKWYYEAVIDLEETVTHLPAHVRIGWANTDGFVPYPGGGSHWGGNGVGDDYYSYSFDGASLWTGGKPKLTRLTGTPLYKGDVIGVCLDLGLPMISYTLNGVPIRGCFKDFNTAGMFFPAISMSAKSSVRFMLGGIHGRLRFGPPDGHSPVCESMKPKEKLKIDSCFNLGNVPKGLICGPVKAIEDATFVPNPVDTHHVPIPTYVENVTEKLAENLHELWAMSKIENGWIWGERRDDQRKIHPCIISYDKLSLTEKQYNISLAQETLRMLIALGYHITFDPQYTSNHRLKNQKLSVNYTQANGYRPSPLDLSGLVLSEKLLDLVESLAENTHNVWAKERIRQGWTYGLTEDFFNRRSHHLVPYSKVDEVIKKSNRQTASETVRTLMAYGYSLESPSTEISEAAVTKDTTEKKFLMRTYRAEMTYAVDVGKWYYEFEVITTGEMRVGWSKVGSRPGIGLGVDGTSYAFDGCTGRKWNQGSELYGKVWQKGDIIGCMLDITDRTICFSLNGELMMDRAGQEIAFKGIDTSQSYVPTISLGANQCARVNFGEDVFTLKFFTCCGLQEGYEPFCVNMTRTMPLWYDKEQPMFEMIKKDHPRLEVVRVPGGSSSPPCLKIHSKAFGTLEKTCLEFIRLTLPVKFPEHFLAPREKQLYYERRMMMEQHKMQPGTHGDEGDYTGDRRLFTKMGLKFGGEGRGGYHGAKRGKSPFNLFKKNKLSRDPSPLGSHEYPHGSLPGMSASEYSMDSDDVESMGGFYPSAATGASHHPHAGGMPGGRMKKKRDSQGSYASEALESEADYRELEMNMDVIDEYYYGVRILPGQDPMQVYVGWVTPQYRTHSNVFDMKSVRNVIITTMDPESQNNVSVSRKNCYMVSAGELHNRYGQQEDSGKKASPGLLIGCMVDVSSGLLSFTVNGQEAANKFQVEPNSMLFPAVFFEPTNKEVLQLEFGRTKTALPLSSVLFRGGKHVQPQCPPRMDLQFLKTFQWSRCPISSNKVHVLKLSDVRGWSMLIEDPDQMMALHIPEEDRCVDILELKEHPHLLNFHTHTLDLYHAVCFLGNHKAAHELTNHVNERQLMFCIKSKYMPGELRMGFHNLLISLHLDAHATSRLMTQREFIVPLVFHNKDLSLFNTNWPHPHVSINYALSQEEQQLQQNQQQQLNNIRESIPSLEQSVSIRPSIVLSETGSSQLPLGSPTPTQATLPQSPTVVTNLTAALNIASTTQPSPVATTSPYFPLDTLKRLMMSLLTEAVEKGGSHIRDPIGGSNANHFVPLIKVVDKLLVIGLLDDRDLSQLLYLIDPVNFDIKKIDDVQIRKDVITARKYGLIQINLSEPVKLELCILLHHLCDLQLRHRIEALVAFTESFVGECQVEQRQRYIDIKQTDMPMAVAAKRTREFRCPPQEQMRSLLSFKDETVESSESPMGEDLKEQLMEFHSDLLRHANYNPPEEEEVETPTNQQTVEQDPNRPLVERLLNYLMNKQQSDSTIPVKLGPDNLQQLITSTVIGWATSDLIVDQALIRAMFSLLHRQYDGVYELMRSLEKTYVISDKSAQDVNNLNRSLGLVRSLLKVQVAPNEEEQLKTSIWDLADNRIFFQHPDLMRSLGIHETVMQLMVNTLNKAQQESANTEVETPATQISSSEPPKDTSAEMVVSCCRFLCYFCRTGRVNQKAMFEHLGYLLDNSCMLLSRPSLRGSCPLDVAYSSLMDNNELALALRESDLDKVAVYLSRCGQQSNHKLVASGYPDLGWDPVEGERFLDFLRFCVWVNGESVEENANLVVRLLIRRPECLGPALRGEGGGLLKAMLSSITMSLQIAAAKNPNAVAFIKSVSEAEDDDRGNYLYQSKFNFSTLPSEDDEDYIDMGAARLQFYSSLVDLLGRCAPEAEAIKAGRSDSLRARAILRSLVSLDDLEGALEIRFMLPVGHIQSTHPEEGEESSGTLPSGLSPQHKTAIVLFLERVYGIQDQPIFFRLLENGFLPDLRAANMLEEAQAGDSDMALALNRYLFNAVLPLLTNYSYYFQEADNASSLLEQTLHTVYKMSKCRSLTKNQRDVVSDFLVALTSQLRPPMMTSLLRKLVIDVPALQENTITPLRVLVNHYERCGGYYGSGGWGMYGSATEEEKRLTMMLFSGIFDSLAKRGYDPELFSKALPCLSAIGCALSPDYSLGNPDESFYNQCIAEAEWVYDPRPIDISRVTMNEQLSRIIIEFAEHYHDSWAMNKIDNGWTFGNNFDEDTKQHPNLKSFQLLSNPDKTRYLSPIESSVKAMLAWGWSVEPDPTRSVNKSQIKKKQSKLSLGDYTPRPADLRGVTLTRGNLEMAEKLAELAHDVWALKKKSELESLGGALNPHFLPYNMLSDKEKKENRDRSQEMLRYMQMVGYRITNEPNITRKEANQRQAKNGIESNGIDNSSNEKRFAYSLLEKLLEYVDKAAYNMRNMKPSARFSRRHSFSMSTEDVKFFGKVVLPLVVRYFGAHKGYFISSNNPQQVTATIKEKEMTASLFSKLALLLRQRISAFGHDVQISVSCLQTIVQAIDARAIVKSSPEIVRSSILPFFTFAADDLAQIVSNLKSGRFSHVKGTITRGATSLNYVHMVLLPVLTSMFDHLGRHGFGADLLVEEEQLCCYKILNALYTLGTRSSSFVQRESIILELARHRSALGECVASFASTFPVAFLEPQLNKFNKHSMVFGIEDENIATHSLEAKEVLEELAINVLPLDKIVLEIEGLAESGGKYNEAPHVIEVTLPMLCSYLPFWWSQGPDNTDASQVQVTTVTADQMNNILGNVLKLVRNNIGSSHAPWMNKIASRTQPIIVKATPLMLKEHFLPVAVKIRDQAKTLDKEEEEYQVEMRRMQHKKDGAEIESDVPEKYQLLVRDMYAFYPLLIKYVDLHRSSWLKTPNPDADQLYLCVADVFNLSTKSHIFKKEEQNFVFSNEIDNMALIRPSQDKSASAQTAGPSPDSKSEQMKPKSKKRVPKKMDVSASLNVACLKRLLPIGLNMFGGKEQELVQQAKQKFVDHYHNQENSEGSHKDIEGDTEEFLKISYHSEETMKDTDSQEWQNALYKRMSNKGGSSKKLSADAVVGRVLAMAKVLHGLHLIEHPTSNFETVWKKAVTLQRKRAVMACFRMVPLYNLSRHIVINLFLRSYKEQWLEAEPPGHTRLIEDITDMNVEEEGKEETAVVPSTPQPISQLITAFTRSATTEASSTLEADFLYISYANIMSQSCHGEEEEEEGGGEGEEGVEEDANPGATLQEQEMEKQKLLFEQSRLSERGAAEMVLMYISASKGQWSDMVNSTIDLGISILMGGNIAVQKRMLDDLKEKKDVGVFSSLAGLMQQCSVLDLDGFERYNKAEGLGVTGGGAQTKNLHDADNTCKLFRFLQLLCEGHNLDFQNYLRTQAGNTSTLNIVICTVDYLLRLQESIMDFYWHYVSKDVIDESGKECFIRAISVASQVFNSISEYIQGPCQGNQLTLAHSRLWDAVGGFLFIFANMQDKLSRDPDQLELLREFMRLQKDMMIMLLSMLEGNVMNGPIGRQMMDTLVESSQNFEMILKFFDIFLKMKDLTSSEGFMDIDVNGDGIITPKEFKRAMELQKIYTEEEIDYVMLCVDANQDGKVDFNEFTERFFDPAKDIGFNVAVLLTNLSEHIPNDPRLQRFLEKAQCVLNYFEPYLGRIEIMGGAERIERVYFEITQDHIDQWEKPQIKESKRAFLHNIVNEEGEKGKLECFVNFCEETIFEMQHANSISAEEQQLNLTQSTTTKASGEEEKFGLLDVAKLTFRGLKLLVETVFACLSPSNLKENFRAFRSTPLKDLIKNSASLAWNLIYFVFSFIFFVFATFFRFIWVMMKGEFFAPLPKPVLSNKRTYKRVMVSSKTLSDMLPRDNFNGHSGGDYGGNAQKDAEEDEKLKEGGGEQQTGDVSQTLSAAKKASLQKDESKPEPTPEPTPEEIIDAAICGMDMDRGKQVAEERETSAGKNKESASSSKGMNFWNFIVCLFARNFYTFKLIALALAFSINLFLLFFKVTKATSDLGDDEGGDEGDSSGDDDDESLESIQMANSVQYLSPVLRIFALLHSFTALAMILGYYCLKVPLVVFKREKEVARSLEFEGLWIVDQPSEDDIKGHWDKLVISTQSFPDKYWDKFVKKKVRTKYAEQYEYEQISSLLGMCDSDSFSNKKAASSSSSSSLLSCFIPSFLEKIDWQYQIWKFGIIITDNAFLYILFYFLFSLLGNLNYFFFAAHLLDVAVCFKTLGTILQSVTHNGKQLVLTVMLLSIVVYLYTVIAFNFFRKFYVQEEDDNVDYKCHDMLSCYIFHLYVGVRAGGGIGDEISPPDGDPYEVYRIFFDITFFFFVIVILLAIIQGLIIDAFGTLRDQLEQVKEDMESSCFICTIGKDYFDKLPHGFETHVLKEHNFANYMFFLMHLINKPDTEYTGQESYVWQLYQQRCWDFFPVGECFRKQYEDELIK